MLALHGRFVQAAAGAEPSTWLLWHPRIFWGVSVVCTLLLNKIERLPPFSPLQLLKKESMGLYVTFVHILAKSDQESPPPRVWWDESDDTALQAQNLKFEHCPSTHRPYTSLSHYDKCERRRNISFLWNIDECGDGPVSSGVTDGSALPFQCGDRLKTSESDVYEILMSYPHLKIYKIIRAVNPQHICIQMKRKEPIKTFMMIWKWKNTLVSMVSYKYI